MTTVAIISEYNPFHTGHKYQIDKIRTEYGDDTRVISIMSGNYVQRGDIAVLDKYLRAECAVRCGVNLVLELPFPFSVSSAEFFAKAAVKIIDDIGVADILSFGSEAGDIKALKNISDNMMRKKYQKKVKDLLLSPISDNLGYPAVCEMACKELYGYDGSFFTPNNILAIEYLKAIKTNKSKLLPHTIKRQGTPYSSENITDALLPSATSIRKILESAPISALEYFPKEIKKVFSDFILKKETPCDSEKLSSLIISHFSLYSANEKKIHDTEGGLYNRLRNASLNATDIPSLIDSAKSKKFTTARIRRGIWYSLFGVTSSDMNELPQYTQALAMDKTGMRLMKEIKKISRIPILTKPSSYDFLSDTAKRQKECSDKADYVFQLTKPISAPASDAMRKTPFILK